MSQYLCLPCGYIYDEQIASEEETALFEQKPVNWVCPECGASKFDFELMDEEE
ncbi:MAG: rubredoxin [Gammaproteobacteria bacterium]|jgi:rubredoxin|nr:rubredoxin [Gammaproteobacteria bacterium]